MRNRTVATVIVVVLVAAVALGGAAVTLGGRAPETAAEPNLVAIESRQLTEDITLSGSLEPLARTITHRLPEADTGGGPDAQDVEVTDDSVQPLSTAQPVSMSLAVGQDDATTTSTTSTTTSTSTSTSTTTVPEPPRSSTTSTTSTPPSAGAPTAPSGQAGSSGQGGQSGDGQARDADAAESPAEDGGAGAAPDGSRTSVVTGVVSVGDVVEAGDSIYRADGVPVLLLPGSTPAWRTLEAGVAGDDVAQLEVYLSELGHDPGSIDDSYTASTASAVGAWQSDLGIESTGIVPLGAVVFAPGAVTVTGVAVEVGDQLSDGDEVLDVAGTQLEASLSVEPALVPLVQPGQEFEVTVRGAPTITATVASVVADPRGGATAVAGLSEQPELAVAPVSVTARRATTATDESLVVAAGAIVKLDAGRYAVRLADGSLVAVEIIGSSGSTVAVHSDELEVGTEVRAV